MKWFIKCLNQYFDFKGRARRREFWMFYLWTMIIEVVIILLSLLLGGGFPGMGASESVPPELMPRSVGMGMFFSGLITLYGLALFIPQLSVTVRRLHDTGKPGWLLLVYYLVILAGSIYIGFGALKLAETGDDAPVPAMIFVTVAVLFIFSLYLLYLYVRKGDAGSNRYGHNPKDDF